MGWIGSAVWLVAPKRLPGFSFFQLSWVAKIYLIWNPLRPILTLNILSIGTVLLLHLKIFALPLLFLEWLIIHSGLGEKWVDFGIYCFPQKEYLSDLPVWFFSFFAFCKWFFYHCDESFSNLFQIKQNVTFISVELATLSAQLKLNKNKQNSQICVKKLIFTKTF